MQAQELNFREYVKLLKSPDEWELDEEQFWPSDYCITTVDGKYETYVSNSEFSGGGILFYQDSRGQAFCINVFNWIIITWLSKRLLKILLERAKRRQ